MTGSNVDVCRFRVGKKADSNAIEPIHLGYLG